MIATDKKMVYKAFGLSVSSEIPLPELPCLEDKLNSVDVEIVAGNLAEIWDELSDNINTFVVKENFVMFQVPDVAIFSIQNGKRITVTTLKKNAEDHIRLYILGTCMGALLMQRKVLPLHGSAVAINGKAYCFVGNSGAGKSTLASGLMKQGYQLVSDDVVAVSLLQDDEVPFVTPSYPNQKLWDDSLSCLGMEANQYTPIFGREKKFSVPVHSNYYSGPLQLGGVFELIKTNNHVLKIRNVESLERFYTLYYNSYQNSLIQNLGLMDWHFQLSTKIINQINVYQIQRPISENDPSKLVFEVLNIIGMGESNHA